MGRMILIMGGQLHLSRGNSISGTWEKQGIIMGRMIFIMGGQLHPLIKIILPILICCFSHSGNEISPRKVKLTSHNKNHPAHNNPLLFPRVPEMEFPLER